MMSSTSIAMLGLVTLSSAAAFSSRHCFDVTVPVTLNATLPQFDFIVPSTNIEAANFVLDLTEQGEDFVNSHVTGTKNIHKSYSIAGTYCEPTGGPAHNTVQLLTHGLGFDRRYWDFPANNYNYSYVNPTLQQTRTAVFFYDRLGIGQSSHGEPENEIQAMLEVAVIDALTEKLRQGQIPNVKRKFDKVIHVGHSFGSYLTFYFASVNPTQSDGLVLTGFSLDTAGGQAFLYGADFVVANTKAAYRDYPAGYLIGDTETSNQIDFFSPGDFDGEILKAATEASEPVSIGELITNGLLPPNGTTFDKPILVITGERDLPFCGGDCYSSSKGSFPSIPAQVAASFPNDKQFHTFVVPGAGHGLNLLYSHVITYETINTFLQGIVA